MVNKWPVVFLLCCGMDSPLLLWPYTPTYLHVVEQGTNKNSSADWDLLDSARIRISQLNCGRFDMQQRIRNWNYHTHPAYTWSLFTFIIEGEGQEWVHTCMPR